MSKEVNANQCPLSDKERIEKIVAEVFGDAKYNLELVVSFCNKIRISIVYWDFLPEKEVMQMIGRKLPGVEILLGRDYSEETMKSALMEMCESDEHLWCYDLYGQPYYGSAMDIAMAWLADKRITYSKEGKYRRVADKIQMFS